MCEREFVYKKFTIDLPQICYNIFTESRSDSQKADAFGRGVAAGSILKHKFQSYYKSPFRRREDKVEISVLINAAARLLCYGFDIDGFCKRQKFLF